MGLLLSLVENFLCLFQLITDNVNRLTGMDMGWRLHESIAKAVCTIFLHECVCVCVCSVMSNSLWLHGLWPTRLLCPWNSPGKILEWVAISYSKGYSQTSDWTRVSCRSFTTGRQILYHWTTWEGSFSYKNAFQPRTISPLPLGHSQKYLEPFLIITTEERYWQLLG